MYERIDSAAKRHFMHVEAVRRQMVKPIFSGAGNMNLVAGVGKCAKPGPKQFPGHNINCANGEEAQGSATKRQTCQGGTRLTPGVDQLLNPVTRKKT